MNIFIRELKANLKSLLIWSGISVIFIMVGFSKFSAFYENPELLVVLDGIPPAMMDALNMNAFNLTTVTGFYGVMMTYFALILSISAAMWGSEVITKEERDRTVEFSLTLPVSRFKLVTAKTAAVLVNCVFLLLVTWGGILMNVRQYAPDPAFYEFVNVSIRAFYLMQMIFMAIGILLGCALKHHKQAGSAAVSILLATYFASILSGLNPHMDFLKFVSPFKYFDPVLLLHDAGLDPIFILLSLAIIVVSLAGAYLSYSKRDLYI